MLFRSTFLMNILKKKVTNTEGTGFDLFSAILDAFRENDTARDTIFGLMGNVAGETLSNMTMGALIAVLGTIWSLIAACILWNIKDHNGRKT